MKKLFSWLPRRRKETQSVPEPKQDADFTLQLDGVPIGHLFTREGVWCFKYSNEFRSSGKWRPFVDFPDHQRVYESPELFPFFETRIPSPKQNRVKQILEREKIDAADDVSMLRRFGRYTVANPFELVSSS